MFAVGDPLALSIPTVDSAQGLEVRMLQKQRARNGVNMHKGLLSGVTPANQTKKGQFMNFSQGHSGTKVQCESCLFSQGKTPEFTKMGEIHELFVLPPFFGLVCRGDS